MLLSWSFSVLGIYQISKLFFASEITYLRFWPSNIVSSMFDLAHAHISKRWPKIIHDKYTDTYHHMISYVYVYIIDHYCALLLFNVQIGEKIRLLTPSATHGLWDRSCPTRQKETGWSAGVRGFDPSPKAPMLSICMNLLYHHISSIFISIQSNESRAKETNSQRTQTRHVQPVSAVVSPHLAPSCSSPLCFVDPSKPE